MSVGILFWTKLGLLSLLATSQLVLYVLVYLQLGAEGGVVVVVFIVETNQGHFRTAPVRNRYCNDSVIHLKLRIIVVFILRLNLAEVIFRQGNRRKLPAKLTKFIIGTFPLAVLVIAVELWRHHLSRKVVVTLGVVGLRALVLLGSHYSLATFNCEVCKKYSIIFLEVYRAVTVFIESEYLMLLAKHLTILVLLFNIPAILTLVIILNILVAAVCRNSVICVRLLVKYLIS